MQTQCQKKNQPQTCLVRPSPKSDLYLWNHQTRQGHHGRAMHNLVCGNFKLTRRVLTKNLMTKLMRLKCGTNEVEKYADILCKNVRKGDNRKLIEVAI